MTAPQIETIAFFDSLAREMNAHPERYEVLGDVDMSLAILMTRSNGADLRVRLQFEGIQCTGVDLFDAGEEHLADCWLEGALADWQAMFDGIVANGRAEGRQTINSLTMLGDRISAHGDDPLGVDKFFRFNQTVQQFLDGAAAVAGEDTSERERHASTTLSALR